MIDFLLQANQNIGEHVKLRPIPIPVDSNFERLLDFTERIIKKIDSIPSLTSWLAELPHNYINSEVNDFSILALSFGQFWSKNLVLCSVSNARSGLFRKLLVQAKSQTRTPSKIEYGYMKIE